jgi:RNA polymerase sigma-70 factor (ECF subfamily)
MSDLQSQFLAHYETYRDKIYTYLFFRVGFRREVAEDLTQDTFIRAFDAFVNFDAEKGTFQAWIYRIAHNLLVNHYRDHKLTADIDAAHGLASKEDLAAAAGDHLEAERIIATLDLLDSEERELLLLRHQQNLGNKELADVLHKSEGSVRTALSRATTHLREIYLKLYPPNE